MCKIETMVTCSSVKDDRWLAAAQASSLGEKWLIMALVEKWPGNKNKLEWRQKTE